MELYLYYGNRVVFGPDSKKSVKNFPTVICLEIEVYSIIKSQKNKKQINKNIIGNPLDSIYASFLLKDLFEKAFLICNKIAI